MHLTQVRVAEAKRLVEKWRDAIWVFQIKLKTAPCSQLKESTDPNPRRGRLSRDIKLAFFKKNCNFASIPPFFFAFLKKNAEKVAEMVAEDSY